MWEEAGVSNKNLEKKIGKKTNSLQMLPLAEFEIRTLHNPRESSLLLLCMFASLHLLKDSFKVN